MAKDRESRLAQILRQELQAGTNLPQALAMANVAALREKGDYRRLFPKTGVLGQILKSTLGKEYRYDRSSSISSTGASARGSAAGTLSAGAIRLTARNTMVLPAMARDMNIMKQNISSLVRATGKRAFARPERNYLGTGPKKSNPGAAAGSSSSAGGDSVLSKLFSGAGFATSLASGIVSNLFSVMGSMLSFGGSLISGAVGILGSVLGGAMNIGGGVLGGLLGGLGSVVRGMGIFGVIALAGAGFLMYQISKNITGELSFDKIVNYIKESLGLDKGESFRDAMFRAFGFIDKKTGLDTQGTFVTVEKQFVGWLAYSKSILSSVVTAVENTGKLALLEMQEAFLTYGTGVIKILSMIAGTAMGAQAGFDIGSILASLALMPVTGGASGVVGITGMIGRVLFGVGSMAAGTALGGFLGMKGGESAGEAINKMLTDPMLTKEQREVLEGMAKSNSFQSQIEGLKQNQSIMNKYAGASTEGLDPNSRAYRDNVEFIKNRERAAQGIKDIKKNPTYKAFMDRYHAAFGTTDLTTDLSDLRTSGALSSIRAEKQALKDRMPTIESAKKDASAEQDAAEKNYVPPSPTRLVNPLGPSSEFKATQITGKFGGDRDHNGLDIRAAEGTPIYAASGGVVSAFYTDAGGNQITITDKNGFKTGYAHLSAISVSRGEEVQAGDLIGKSGSTGPKGTPPHLHFTVTDKNNKKLDPEQFLMEGKILSPMIASTSPAPTAPAPAGERDGITDFLSGQNKYEKMSESELLMEIMGDMFGDITKVLSGMMSNLSKGGPDRAAADASADVHDIHGTQMTQALQGRLFYSMTG